MFDKRHKHENCTAHKDLSKEKTFFFIFYKVSAIEVFHLTSMFLKYFSYFPLFPSRPSPPMLRPLPAADKVGRCKLMPAILH